MLQQFQEHQRKQIREWNLRRKHNMEVPTVVKKKSVAKKTDEPT